MKFDEQVYLAANPDVAAAVMRGQFPSGLAHYEQFGRFEKRPGAETPRHNPIFFCHLPKTAGTSLRKALEATAPRHAVLPDDFMIARHGGLYPPTDIFKESFRYQASTVRIVRGHYHISLASLLDSPIVMTVLREPVARTVSNLKNAVRNGMTLDRVHSVLARGGLPVETNLMLRYLGDTATADFDRLRGQVDKSTLATAIAKLPSIQCLGVVERMEAFLCSIEEVIGFRIAIERKNVSAEMDLGLSEKQMSVIARHNDLDRRLYEAAIGGIDRRAG